jgi:hypothetical protein
MLENVILSNLSQIDGKGTLRATQFFINICEIQNNLNAVKLREFNRINEILNNSVKFN